MKSRTVAAVALLSLSTLPFVPACRCASSDPGAAAGGAPAAAVDSSAAPTVSIDSAAVRRVNVRPNIRPLVLNPSAVRPPTTPPPPSP